MARIAEEVIQQVLAATDIVDVIGRSVKLRRVGGDFRGLCPFHQEKTPSFYVSPSRGAYHCFGCGAGGTVIRFLMDYESLAFPEAVQRLAESAGIVLRHDADNPEAMRDARITGQLKDVHTRIAEWYHRLLLDSPGAETARAYLAKRGLEEQTVAEWKLGYAPPDHAALVGFARDHGLNASTLVAAGLLALREDTNPRAGTYARFRDRLMFPIRDDQGQVIAFSGRLLDPEAKAAKYLNSPETRLFQKSRVLFGLDKSRRDILREQVALVCEGQIDLITCFEHGLRHVVAPLGTSLTEQHARLLRRHAPEVILCFDADTAGYKAAVRAFGTLAQAGLLVRVAALPPGQDPDSLIRQQGVDHFRQLTAEAADFFQYQIDHLAGSLDLNSLRDRTRIAGELAVTLAQVEPKVTQDAAIQRTAMVLGLTDQALRHEVAVAQRELARLSQRPPRHQAPGAGTDGDPGGNDRAPAGAGGRDPDWGQAKPRQQRGTQGDQRELPDPSNTVAMLCRLALTEPDCLHWLREEGDRELLSQVPQTELLALVWDSAIDPDQPGSMAAFFASLPPALERQFSRLLHRRQPGAGLDDMRRAWQRLELDAARADLRQLQARLRRGGAGDDLASIHQSFVSQRKHVLDLERRLRQLPQL